MTSGKVITCCGDCVHYNFRKHECNVGHSAEVDPREKFYADCTTFENVEEYERKAYNKAVDDLTANITERFFGMAMSSGLPTEGATWENAIRQVKQIAEKLKGAKQNED